MLQYVHSWQHWNNFRIEINGCHNLRKGLLVNLGFLPLGWWSLFGDPPLGLGSEDFRDFFMGWGGGKGGAVSPAINPGFLIIEAWRLSGVRSNIPIGTLLGSWFILAKWAAKMPPLPPPRFAWAEPTMKWWSIRFDIWIFYKGRLMEYAAISRSLWTIFRE